MTDDHQFASGQIFLYHALVEKPLALPDPCFIDARLFRRQMLYLLENFQVVALAELREAMATRQSRPVAAITFDDGFMNNCSVALPILRELQLPATVFLCTDLVDSDATIWFCQVNRAVSESTLSSVIWRGEAFDLSSCSARLAASLRIQQAIKQGSPLAVASEVEDVVRALGGTPTHGVDADSPYAMLTSASIAEMLDSGLIDFGAHTRTHAILGRLTPEQQSDEILGSIEAVQRLTSRPCRMFAYPNGTRGDYDGTTLAILSEAGVELAVTAIHGVNRTDTPALELLRTGFEESLVHPPTRLTSATDQVRAEKRRRVLFAYHSMGLGGVETATLAKVAALESVGVEAWVYFHRAYGEGGFDFARHPRVMVGLEDEATLGALLDQGWDMISVIDYPDLLDVIARRGVDRPVIYETHTAHPAFHDRSYPRLSSSIIRKLIAPSNVHAGQIRRLAPEAPPVAVIPNTVDTERFHPLAPIGPIPVLCKRPDERPLLWIGRLEAEKNPEEFVAIGRALLERGTAVRLVVVGDLPGEYDERKARLEELATDQLAGSIEWIRGVPHAYMPDVFAWVAAGEGVLVSTSRLETQPMIMLEAMAAGCPVVSTDVGGVGELIQDGSTGRLYPLGDVDAAAQAIAEVLENTARTAEMTERARELVLDRHSPTAVARSYLALLDELNVQQRERSTAKGRPAERRGRAGIGERDHSRVQPSGPRSAGGGKRSSTDLRFRSRRSLSTTGRTPRRPRYAMSWRRTIRRSRCCTSSTSGEPGSFGRQDGCWPVASSSSTWTATTFSHPES